MSLYYKINMLRQLYELRSHRGVQIDRWIYASPDQQPVEAQSMLIPQLSLHTTGGTVLDTHVYGRQAAAQVYGNVTATQEILDSAAGSAQQFPWVRYYARRFGDTTVPLKLDSPTITGSGLSVQITPSEFDALDEIVDGWKEVTLRFDTPPTMGAGTSPQWRWSATGEIAGNRWEVLGAYAPALSGTPGNFTTAVPTPNQLSLATYGAPVSGANENLGWVPGYAPMVSATTDDQTADAVLMFARDFPVITGFSASVEDQQVVGIGLDCGLDPCCVPTEIQYNLITWGLPVNTGYGSDTFSRTVAPNEWGTAESGQAWNESSTVNTTWEVADGQGVITVTTATSRYNLIDVGGPDQDVRGTVIISTPVISSQIRAGLMLRATDSDNGYMVRITMTSSAVSLDVLTRIAGTDATLASVNIPALGSSSTVPFIIRAQIVGNRIVAKVWASVQDEPGWLIDITDNSITTGDNAGILVRELGGNTTVVYYWDDFSVGPPDIYFGSYELQRMDTVTTTWQTIMSATSPLVTGFSDYEARVGIMSSYRIRAVDLYDFPGPWSTEVTATIPAPGVTIGCDDGHLLIFTSNEEQDGSLNLAYSSVWEQGRTVEEGFLFPESQFVQLQALYNRDFFLAFRPQERGGEQFSRTVLVQAAAISPETLADFTSLRDMAWADVPYICVRDEDGNRWFATVLVPSGRVLRDRRLYLAPVEVIEVTSTPSEVDP